MIIFWAFWWKSRSKSFVIRQLPIFRHDQIIEIIEKYWARSFAIPFIFVWLRKNCNRESSSPLASWFAFSLFNTFKSRQRLNPSHYNSLLFSNAKIYHYRCCIFWVHWYNDLNHYIIRCSAIIINMLKLTPYICINKLLLYAKFNVLNSNCSLTK